MTTTATQPTLFSGVPRPPKPRLSIDERFAVFHRDNPQVFQLFKRFAAELLDAGHKRGSAEQIVQRIRWEHAMLSPREGGFKFNDHFRSRYARMLAKDDERFRDFFEFRVSGRA